MTDKKKMCNDVLDKDEIMWNGTDISCMLFIMTGTELGNGQYVM